MAGIVLAVSVDRINAHVDEKLHAVIQRESHGVPHDRGHGTVAGSDDLIAGGTDGHALAQSAGLGDKLLVDLVDRTGAEDDLKLSWASKTPWTPVTSSKAALSTFLLSAMTSLSRVAQWAAEMTFSLPPMHFNTSAAAFA